MNFDFPSEASADQLWNKALLARIHGNSDHAAEFEASVLRLKPQVSPVAVARYRLDVAKWAAWCGASPEWVEEEYLTPIEREMSHNVSFTLEIWVMRAYIAIFHPLDHFRNLEHARQSVVKADLIIAERRHNEPAPHSAVLQRLSFIRRELGL